MSLMLDGYELLFYKLMRIDPSQGIDMRHSDGNQSAESHGGYRTVPGM